MGPKVEFHTTASLPVSLSLCHWTSHQWLAAMCVTTTQTIIALFIGVSHVVILNLNAVHCIHKPCYHRMHLLQLLLVLALESLECYYSHGLISTSTIYGMTN